MSRFFLFLILLFMVPFVQAIGISYTSDALAPITYRPNGVETKTYYVMASGEEAVAVSVGGGELTKYAAYDKIVKITGSMTPFTVTFTFPNKRFQPGFYNLDVTVFQITPTGSDQFGLLAGAQVPLYVRVLDPSAYIEFSSFRREPQNVKRGEPVQFTFGGVNYGEKDIKSAKGIVSVYDGNKLVETISSASKTVKSQASVELSALWQTKKYKIGEYKITGKIIYDGKETSIKETTIFVGNEDVIVQNYTHYLTNDSVNPFSVEIMSLWNVPIDFSAGITLIQNAAGLASFKTPTETLVPWTPKKVDGFVDTRGFALGKYAVNLTLFAGKKQSVYEGAIEIVAGKPSVIIKEVEKPALISLEFLYGLAAIVVILVVINIIFIIAYTRRKKYKSK